jgi:hypothetical protein
LESPLCELHLMLSIFNSLNVFNTYLVSYINSMCCTLLDSSRIFHEFYQ